MEHQRLNVSWTSALQLISIISFVLTYLFQIPATVTRILLNHFKWDKEKLMEW